MKIIEILNFNRKLLKRLQIAGIRLENAQYIDLQIMKRCGNAVKKSCIRWLYWPTNMR